MGTFERFVDKWVIPFVLVVLATGVGVSIIGIIKTGPR
jgi:hypothetical protein